MILEQPRALVIPEDVLCALARDHLHGLDGVHVAPDIPSGKLERARAEHRLHLPAHEPVAVLFDATSLGSARDGFLLTPAQLCWKGFWEHARRILWEDLRGAPIAAGARDVELAHGHVPAPWTAAAPERVRDLLIACRDQRPLGTPYRNAAFDRAPVTLADAILRAARRHLGEREWVHYDPSIPPGMLAAVRTVHERLLEPHEDILVLYDDTVFGSGNDGLVFTERGVHWRGFLGRAEHVAWRDVVPDRIDVDGDLVSVLEPSADAGDRRIDLRMRPGMGRIVAEAIAAVARLVP